MTQPYYERQGIQLFQGDVREVLRELPSESVNCVVTSPPYWGLRDYGTASWEGGDAECGHVPPTRARTERPREGLTGGTATIDAAEAVYRDLCGKCGAKRIDQQLGLEATPEAYICAMVEVFREVRRVLRKDGTLWCNIGDSYAGSNAMGRAGSKMQGMTRAQFGEDYDPSLTKHGGKDLNYERNGLKYEWWGGSLTCDHQDPDDAWIDMHVGFRTRIEASTQGTIKTCLKCKAKFRPKPPLTSYELELQERTPKHLWGYYGVENEQEPFKQGYLKPKDLVGIPWMLAFALRADGWWLRQDIIWAKPNPMPESVTDRCTKAHEYLFLLTKSERYYYDADAIRESAIRAGDMPGGDNARGEGVFGLSPHAAFNGEVPSNRNKRSVWTIATEPYPEAHFATFPSALVRPCVLAGCPEGGTVLDPFIGSGTTAAVANSLGRNAIGIDLSAEYLSLAEKRIGAQLMMPIWEGA